MEWNLLDVVLRVSFVLFSTFLISIITILAIRLAKIDIKDFSQRIGVKFMLIALAGNLALILVVFLFMHFVEQKSFLSLGFHFPWFQSLFSFFFTVLLSLLFVLVLRYKGKTNFHVSLSSFNGSKTKYYSILLSLFVLFIAALQEEIMFRGYLAFVFHEYSMVTAMILSTTIFTLWHFISNKVSLFQAIDWFICGIVLFFVYWESHSIWLIVILHYSRNISNVLIWNISNNYSFIKFETPPKASHKTIYTMTWALLAGFILLIIY
jgi:uncharacterized protein